MESSCFEFVNFIINDCAKDVFCDEDIVNEMMELMCEIAPLLNKKKFCVAIIALHQCIVNVCAISIPNFEQEAEKFLEQILNSANPV